jgi:FkbM family methyltransferase
VQTSAVVLGIADRFPNTTRTMLWLWTQSHRVLPVDRNVYDHWLVDALVRRLQCRIPVHTRLGNGMKIKVHLRDHVGGAIIRSGYYEARTVRLIESLLAPGMVFVDVGTHVGQYTLVASALVGSSGAVHSFEPDPATFAWFASNVRRNRLANVRANHAAVAAKAGKLKLYLSSVNDIGSNSLEKPPNFSGRVCDVDCVVLDDYLAGGGVSRVDLMKIDVEGAEGEVLAGASKLLSSADRPVLILEFEEERQVAFGRSCEELAASVCGYGYELFRLDSENLDSYVPRETSAPSVNVLAVPSNKLRLIDDLRRQLA